MRKTKDGWYVYRITKGSFSGWHDAKDYYLGGTKVDKEGRAFDSIFQDMHLGSLAKALLHVKEVYPDFNLDSDWINMWAHHVPFFKWDAFGVMDDRAPRSEAFIVIRVEIPWLEEDEKDS